MPSNASATDYYVHADIGNNSNSGQAPGDAFQTLTHALRQLSPGDTLYLRSGTYRDNQIWMSSAKYKSGTASQPITIRPYLTEKPLISTPGDITIADLSWWVFEDLVFQNSGTIKLGNPDGTILPVTDRCVSYAEDITIRRNRFQHGTKNGITIKCARRVDIQDNLFDNLRSRVEGRDTDAIRFLYYAKDIVISGNHFSDMGGDGILFVNSDGAWHGDILIADNEFRIIHPYTYRDTNGDTVPADLQPFDSVGESAIDIKQGPGPIQIERNTFHGFRMVLPEQDASGSQGIAVGVHMNGSGVTLAKNHFYDNVGHIVIIRGITAPSDQPIRDTVIRNNIFEDVIHPGGIYEDYPWRETALRIAQVRGVEVLNNTFFQSPGNEKELLFLLGISDVSLLNNTFQNGTITTQWELPSGNWNNSFGVIANNNAWSGISGEINNNLIGIYDITTDNLMLDWSTWTPQEGSPLIDAGTPVGIADDINDAPISGLGPDIGAGEYQHSVQNEDIQAPSASITNSTGGTNSSSGSSGNGGGCTIHTSARIDPVWLLIFLIASARYVRTRYC